MIEIQLSTQSPYQIDADVLVVLTHNTKKQGLLRELDRKLEGYLSEQIEREQFKAKDGQKLSCSTLGQLTSPQLMLYGLGEDAAEDLLLSRKAGADVMRAVQGWKPTSVAIALAQQPEELSEAVAGLALGASLSTYRFASYKSGDNNEPEIETLTLLLPSKTSAAQQKSLQASLEQAQILAQSISTARDLVNEPGNILTPTEMAQRAEAMAEEYGLTCHIHGPEQLAKRGMNLFMAVSAGSVEEPRLIHLHYRPKGRKRKNQKVIALVGKGVTFDSGGLSLKPTAHMLGMHADMAGAAAVFGAIQAIAQYKPTVEVHAFLGCAENMTGAAAYKINDIIKAYNGKYVEIKNTDAEGRLVLADTMAYAAEQGVQEIIDVATLTGACVVALGPWYAGLMGNHQPMVDDLLNASHTAGEAVWQLPLDEELRSSLKSHTADLSNVGGRYGGAISAALFLREFVPEEMHWAHLDIAGPSFADKDLHHISKAGTGFGVATLVQYVLDQQA